MGKKVVIVGGVAGGASAAARLRRLDENVQIVMFEKGEYISFANCGLPYYIGGVIEERNALLVQTPEAMKARFNIDVRTLSEVIEIERLDKKIKVKDLRTGSIYEENYDTLILSPGSTPLKPPIPGIDGENIFVLWNMNDVDKIKNHVVKEKPKRAIVIGGGFIGIEMAENLYELGMEVSVVEMANQVMAPIDFEMAQGVHQHIRSKGVKLYLENGVKNFEKNGNITQVHLQDGTVLESELVILSIGIKAQTQLAKDAGLELNARGGIVVDDYLKTNDENIYAIGDAIEVVDFIDKNKTMIPLAGPANKQGRIVADNICGKNMTYKGSQGTSVAKVFDLTVAATGHNEKILNRKGLVINQDYKVAIIHSKSHAGYYPGAIPLTIKLIFELEGKILGAQIVGYEGVDKRIDVIATAIRFGGKIEDLAELELAYAPPYSSAKDPVNMVGFVAQNMLNDGLEVAYWDELKTINTETTIVLDVRNEEERLMGFVEGSINIPLDQLREQLSRLDKEKTIITYCAIGLRGYIAQRILLQNGFKKVKNYMGGYTTYASNFEKQENCSGIYCQGTAPFSESGDTQVKAELEENLDEATFLKLNACGLACPGPIMQVSKRIEAMENGQILEVRVTDPGFVRDIDAWCKSTKNTLIKTDKRGKEFVAIIKKGLKDKEKQHLYEPSHNKTMVVFSGDLDKAIASFIIANGAAAMGRKVTMFFTFWGLNILRKNEPVSVTKDTIGKMFGAMMPRGSRKLKLSKMHMMGMGSSMIRSVMDKHNVDSLEKMIEQAKENGVELIACNMSMDLMGIKPEELIDGVKLGGVAAYLGAAEEADTNLFI